MKTSKRKPKYDGLYTITARAAKVTEERILQLSNDASEDIRSGTREEWVAVALYFRKQFDQTWQTMAAVSNAAKLYKATRALSNLSEKYLGEALDELDKLNKT